MEAKGLLVGRQQDWVFMQGAVRENRAHQHHAVQLVWSRHPETVLKCGAQSLQGELILVAGRQRHALSMPQGVVCLLEPRSSWARQLVQKYLTNSRATILESLFKGAVNYQQLPQLLESLLGPQQTPVLEARIDQVVAKLAALEVSQGFAELELKEVCSWVHLSPSRFLHLFSEQLGMPWRSFLVWRRALAAFAAASRGLSLTEAAHWGGYADSAHLSRQFKALFGFQPSQAVKISQFVQVPEQ